MANPDSRAAQLGNSIDAKNTSAKLQTEGTAFRAPPGRSAPPETKSLGMMSGGKDASAAMEAALANGFDPNVEMSWEGQGAYKYRWDPASMNIIVTNAEGKSAIADEKTNGGGPFKAILEEFSSGNVKVLQGPPQEEQMAMQARGAPEGEGITEDSTEPFGVDPVRAQIAQDRQAGFEESRLGNEEDQKLQYARENEESYVGPNGIAAKYSFSKDPRAATRAAVEDALREAGQGGE